MRGREGEREERNIDVREKHGCLFNTNLQTRCVPWLGIELVTFHFAEWHPTNWAMPVRTLAFSFVVLFSIWWLCNILFSFSCFWILEKGYHNVGSPWVLAFFFYTQYYINKIHPFCLVWLWIIQISLLCNISFCQGTRVHLSILLLKGIWCSF